MERPIYLDHNATTAPAAEVIDAMAEVMRAGHANPASQHEPGRQARRLIESARERVIELLGGETAGRQPDRLIFTSGGTEANNLAIFGLSGRLSASDAPPPQVITSPIEHPSIAQATDELQRRGWRVDRLGVGRSGVVDVDSLKPLLSEQTRLVSVMLGNNETGALQPVARLAEICTTHNTPLHTDAVQAVGKIDVHFRQLGVSALSLAAHKFHGPVGIGALLVRGDVDIQPQLFGGFQQAGQRPGTESVPLVVGLRKALELWHAECQQRESRMASLRDRLEQQILAQVPAARVIAQTAARLPHTSNIAFLGADRQALAMALDMAGVACSTGSACASGSSEPSPVLLAMGCEEAEVKGSIRLSLGAKTTAADIDEAASRISLACNRLQL